ncbi:MAG: MarR family transcriptional regulator [Deltaproteobacteria bacterium]|nr:MarR family transcriptional regulator [Deltaproteobacteria bacterium]
MSIPADAAFTDKQGQYLAFIYLYTKLHRRPPAEADMQEYFEVTPRSCTRWSSPLEKRGLIRREPGRARTIEILVPPAQLPELR